MPDHIIDRQASTNDRLRREPLFSLRTDPTPCNEISKVINHNLVNKHACSLPQNINAVTYHFVAGDNRLKLHGKLVLQTTRCVINPILLVQNLR